MRLETLSIGIVLLWHLILSACAAAPEQVGQLAHLIATNKPGQYRVEPPWVGETRQTVATGFFSKRPDTPEQERILRELHFDLFTVSEKPSAFGSKVISMRQARPRKGHSKLHTYRESFPTDTELTAANTLSALTNLFGSSQGFTTGWGSDRVTHATAGWSFFRFRDDMTIETLSVFCFTTYTNGQPETYVDSITIRRGVARPTR